MFPLIPPSWAPCLLFRVWWIETVEGTAGTMRKRIFSVCQHRSEKWFGVVIQALVEGLRK